MKNQLTNYKKNNYNLEENIMMNKRFLTGTLAAVMALSTMATGLSFADETTSTKEVTNGRPGVEQNMTQEEREAQKEEREAEMQAIIDEYYPSISDEWTELHDDFETTMDAIKELVQPEEGERPERTEGERPEGGKGGRGPGQDGERPDFENMTDEEIEAFKTEMSENREAKLENGERPEAGQKDGNREGKGGPRGGKDLLDNRPDFENMTDEEIEAYKVEREALRAERQAQAEAFKTALEEEDADTIIDILDDMFDHAEERLELAEEKLAELQAAE